MNTIKKAKKIISFFGLLFLFTITVIDIENEPCRSYSISANDFQANIWQ